MGAASRALERVADGSLEAVGFTGQMHALVPVEAGRSLGQVRLWLDVEGKPHLDAFVRAHRQLSLLRRTGNIPLPDFTLAKWLALRAESPEVADRVESLPAAKDFVRDAFVAELRILTDLNEAAGTQWFDPFKRVWSPAICAAADIPRDLLGEVVAPTMVVGQTRDRRLLRGIPVIAGAGDQQAAARAQGSGVEGRASLSLGTSGVIFGPVAAPCAAESMGRCLPPLPDRSGGRVPGHCHHSRPGRLPPMGSPPAGC